MTDSREKLIELIGRARTAMWGKTISDIPTEDAFIADHLIANGVTVGDKRVPTAERFWIKENGEIVPLSRRWIPVTERLPELWKDVLLYDAINKEIKWGCMCEDCWLGVRINGKVTHWMPVEPPKGECV